MARSFGSTVNKIIKETAKAQRAAERSRNAAIREQERHLRLQRQYERENERVIKQSIREQKAYEKEQKALYIEGRKEETNDLNAEVLYRINEFKSIISETLNVDDTISYETLYKKDEYPAYVEPYVKPVPENPVPLRENYFTRVTMKPSFIEKISGLGKKARLRVIEIAENTYNYALRDYESAEMRRNELIKENEKFLSTARAEYDEAKRLYLEEIASHNSSIDDFRISYFNKYKEAIEAYNTMVLERSNYSDIFPQTFNLFYLEESKELLVEYELPDVTAVPQNKEYKYTQSRDEIKGVPFKPKELNEIYSLLVASIALRTLHELFEADQGAHLDSVVFNGVVSTVDLSTGLDIRPCIVTIQTGKEEFMKFDLARVDILACVKGLKAQLSPSVTELTPVKPIVDLDMYDKRFVNERDMISTLDTRTNLLDMNPFDFEHLVCNLFSEIGLESKLTRSSRDGGVDVIAFDPRPIFGGKYVIQAKRYRNTVEVAAVRDLYGTMMNENASKGILVTTSTYGPDARSFAKDKPIELIDGRVLLHMLEEQGIYAKIQL
ncbi:restriction endonuclease [Paenibacillus spiritus]|uniref:Restriction endonuclease n=1 Tax=Paenibacillus spiritus TaxID=2496557 RepID=A0A5J5GCG0_9BACL|nr:restriction endonuclease [Paenibacillus spiritus]KAA9005482.1 restriction endonuclease [Paenibacillus spiritus]